MNPPGYRATAQGDGGAVRMRSRTALEQSQPKTSRHLAMLREVACCWIASRGNGFIIAYPRISFLGCPGD